MHRLQQLIKEKKFENIVVLTGAGISAESGISTFRDSNGLWENHSIEEVASPQGFKKDPYLVHKFYNLRRKQLFSVEPNEAHMALAKIEKHFDNFTLITQNVDDLHERGGSQNILHMHGQLRQLREIETNKVFYFEDEVNEEDYLKLRPNIVWFGEAIMYPDEIQKAFEVCDLYLCIGTSSTVYPAAGFINLAKMTNAVCIEINLEQTPLSHSYDHNLYGKASKMVSELAKILINE